MNRSCIALSTLLAVLAGSLFAGSTARGENGPNGAYVCPLTENAGSDYLDDLFGGCSWYALNGTVPLPPPIDDADAGVAEPAKPAGQTVPLSPPIDDAACDESRKTEEAVVDDFWREVLVTEPAIIVVAIPSGSAVEQDETNSAYDYCSGYDPRYDAEVYGIEPEVEAVAQGVVAVEAVDVEKSAGRDTVVDEDAENPIVPCAPVGEYSNLYDYGCDSFGYDWYGYYCEEVEAGQEIADAAAANDESAIGAADAASASPVASDAIKEPAVDELVDEYDYNAYYSDYQYYENYYDYQSEYTATDPSEGSVAEEADSVEADTDDWVESWYEDYYYDYDRAAAEAVENPADDVIENADEPTLTDADLADLLPVPHALIECAKNGDIRSLMRTLVEAQRRATQQQPQEDYWGEFAEDDTVGAAEPVEVTDNSHVAIPVAASGKQAVLFIATMLDEIGTSLQATSDRLVQLVQEPVDVSLKRTAAETR